jgi:anaphase-promoting complex subunit 10
VSSSKPGCSVAALRTPNTNYFWQSDGPQPHHLNIHFFKLVAISGMRIYLNFDLDESYTPTLIRFAAGTGYHDLQEFSVMRFERPTGWIDVDWEGVGDCNELEMPEDELPVLRCMLVQVRICENHQNGKDTHLRGLQIFARDNTIRPAERHDMVKSLNVTRSSLSEAPRNSKDSWSLGGWLDAPVLR